MEKVTGKPEVEEAISVVTVPTPTLTNTSNVIDCGDLALVTLDVVESVTVVPFVVTVVCEIEVELDPMIVPPTVA